MTPAEALGQGPGGKDPPGMGPTLPLPGPQLNPMPDAQPCTDAGGAGRPGSLACPSLSVLQAIHPPLSTASHRPGQGEVHQRSSISWGPSFLPFGRLLTLPSYLTVCLILLMMF